MCSPIIWGFAVLFLLSNAYGELNATFWYTTPHAKTVYWLSKDSNSWFRDINQTSRPFELTLRAPFSLVQIYHRLPWWLQLTKKCFLLCVDRMAFWSMASICTIVCKFQNRDKLVFYLLFIWVGGKLCSFICSLYNLSLWVVGLMEDHVVCYEFYR